MKWKSHVQHGGGNAYENLANAVILQAVSDYRNALRRFRHTGKENSAMEELESFFLSSWYECLTNLDGKYLVKKLREEANV